MSVAFDVIDHVAVVRIEREAALNSLDAAAKSELRRSWTRIEQSSDIRVAILTGAGSRAFCVGSDLKHVPAEEPSYVSQRFGDEQDSHLLGGFPVSKPVVAAINGHALGGGLELALACDIRIAATDATFGLPEVKVGSMPGAGGTQHLPRAIGGSDAMFLLLTGERISASRALEMRLVSEVHDLPKMLDRAHEIARMIATNAPLSIRATKQLAQAALNVPLKAGLDMERSAWGLLKSTHDRNEGRAAFREKRAPKYLGR